MAENATTHEGPGWIEDLNSMLASTAIHFTAFILLALLTVAGTGGKRGTTLEMTLGGDGTGAAAGPDMHDLPSQGDPLADPAHLLADQNVDLAAALGPANAIDTPASLDAAPVDVSAALAASADLGGGGGLAQRGAGGSGGSALDASPIFGATEGIGRGGGGTGDGHGKYGQASTDFFGIGGYGQTFVYVVDASDSMNDFRKFERARYELLQSIEQLNSDQSFYVIFYNGGAYPMDADKPLLATKDNIAKVTNWINSVEPSGGTYPLPALLMAISMRPDAIYFLSDGQFDPLTIDELRVRNRDNRRLKTRMIPIHTIAFYDRIAEGLMRMIARNSGGEYRYVR